MGVIFTLSSLSSLPSAEKIWWDYILKKTAHMVEYGIFYFLMIRALGERTKRNYLIAFLVCVVYAISDEIHQSFTPGRHPKPTDVGYDSLGMVVVYLKSRGLI